eukprot:3941365-Rhodomonas_salina.1
MPYAHTVRCVAGSWYALCTHCAVCSTDMGVACTKVVLTWAMLVQGRRSLCTRPAHSSSTWPTVIVISPFLSPFSSCPSPSPPTFFIVVIPSSFLILRLIFVSCTITPAYLKSASASAAPPHHARWETTAPPHHASYFPPPDFFSSCTVKVEMRMVPGAAPSPPEYSLCNARC